MRQANSACLHTRDGQDVNLLGVRLSVDVRGLLFEARVEQRFCNPSDTNAEVVYSFPLPWGAVLLGVDVLLGDKHLRGAVTEKQQAQAQYEEAMSEGNAAIMLEQNRDGSYSLNLGNLAAREHCTITLHYAQTLQFEQSGLRLLIPTVIAPRYGDAVRDGGLMPHQEPSHSLLAENPFTLELRLHDELAQARVASSSHPISVAQNSLEQGKVLTVALAQQAWLDRDFVLVIDQLKHSGMAVAARDYAMPEKVAVLASFCPSISTQVPLSVAVKILVDCSGSMAGDSIDAARRALQAVVLQLGEGDRFALSRFGSTVEHRSRGLWKANEITRQDAQQWVGALQADMGGTEMEDALASTFELAQRGSSDVLLITDGEIYAIDSTIEAAKKSGHRVFVVGIGSSPAEAHLRRLAQATGGACDFVAPGEAVEPAVLRMFTRLRSPALADLRLLWPADIRPEWTSPLLPSVFDGDTVNVFALLGREQVEQTPSGLMAGKVRLLGRRVDSEQEQEIGSATFAGQMQEADTLSRMAAAVRLHAHSQDAALNEDEDEAEDELDAVRLAVDYQLVSDKTNFLLVHVRAQGEQATAMPELRKVAQMVPAGWGGSGTVRARQAAYRDTGIRFSYAPRACAPVSAAMEDFELPAFMRTSTSDTGVADGACSDRETYLGGISPQEMCAWLQQIAQAAWPQSYEALRAIGLDARLVRWLEQIATICLGDAYTEQQAVAAFVYWLASSEIYQSSAKPKGLWAGCKSALQGLAGLRGSKKESCIAGINADLLEAIAKGLEGVSSLAWPERVFVVGDEV